MKQELFKKGLRENVTVLQKETLSKIKGGVDSETITVANAEHKNRWPKA
ncbi:hypothetical protein [Tenacibaculum agarivorans]|nr:hypothetical protein [Tenacibaculum agarivorans]